ncbi:MAG: histidine kinase [Bacteroidales bacterium]|nr:histidine kinase [Bacteroidales bacterium]
METRITISLVVLFLLLSLFISAKDTSKVDSLKNVLSKDIYDTARLNTMARLAFAYNRIKEVSEAEKVVHDAFMYAKKNSLQISYQLHWANAEVLHYKKDISGALDEMNIVAEKLYESENLKELGLANNFRAWNLLYDGKFIECIEAYTKNIEFAKENKLIGILPSAYNGLAYVYKNIDNTEERRKSLIMMADASLKEKNIKYTSEAYFLLGDIGMEKDSNFTYAIKQYNESLKLKKEMKDTIGISFLLLRIGWNHYLNNELETALDYFLHSLEYSIPINRLTSITNAYGNIGTIYRDKKEYKKAIKYYKESINYSMEAKDWYNLSWLYKDISGMFVDLDDYPKAYDNFVLHKQYSDSLEMIKYSKGLSDARTSYETEKQKQELELLSLKLKQHKYYMYGSIGLVVLVILLGILFIRQNRLNSKRKITEMNHKISEITQKNLRQQMNPHFIFNTLNSIQYYMYQHDKISTNNYLTKFSSLMRKTLENSQHTAIPIKDEIDALELYLQLELIRFKEKFDYEINIDEEIDTLLYKIPTMLIQPYVENSICHGLINKDEKGKLTIDLNLKDESIACSIEDNGIGREAALEIKKQKNGNHNSLGTKITESRLNLVNALYGKNMKVDYMDLKDKDGNPNGTKVVIHIPIMT